MRDGWERGQVFLNITFNSPVVLYYWLEEKIYPAMSLIACLQFLSLTLSCRCDVFVTVQQWATQQGTTPSSSSILCSLIPSSFNICYVPFLLIAFILATFTLGPKHKKIIPMYPFSRGPSLWSTVKSLVYANRSRYHSRYALSSPPSLLLKFFLPASFLIICIQ